MAAYGRGDYGAGRYSFGAYLGALAIVSASTVTVAGEATKDASFTVVSTSSVSIDSIKILSSSVVINDTSVITIDAGLIAVGNIDMAAVSNLNVQYNRIQHFSTSIVEFSSVSINARKKWEIEEDTSETWTPIDDVSESWTTVSV